MMVMSLLVLVSSLTSSVSSLDKVARANSAKEPPLCASGASPTATSSSTSSLLTVVDGFVLTRFTLRRFNTIFRLSLDLNLVRFTGVILDLVLSLVFKMSAASNADAAVGLTDEVLAAEPIVISAVDSSL